MEGKFAADGIGGIERQILERVSWEGKEAARGGVDVVIGLVIGNDHVVGIVAAVEEKADQGLVISCGWIEFADVGSGGGIDQAQVPDGGDEGGCADGSAGRVTEKIAPAGIVLGLSSSHGCSLR